MIVTTTEQSLISFAHQVNAIFIGNAFDIDYTNVKFSDCSYLIFGSAI